MKSCIGGFTGTDDYVGVGVGGGGGGEGGGGGTRLLYPSIVRVAAAFILIQ